MDVNILKKNSTSWFTILKYFNLTILRILEGIKFQVTLRLFSLQQTTTTMHMLLCIHAASETENIIMYF